jgi:hypothetical protein
MRKLFIILLLLLFTTLNGETFIRNVDGFEENPIMSKVLFFDDFSISMVPARPVIPVKNERILLKPFSKNIRVKIISAEYKTYKTDKIQIAYPPASNKINWEKWRNERDKFLKSDIFYPENIVEIKGTGYFRKYRYVDISVFPLQYNPVKCELKVYSNIKYEISFNTPAKLTEKQINILNDNNGYPQAKDMFDNFNDLRNSYKTDIENDRALCDLLILTNSNLLNTVDTLVKWKQSIGVNCKVVKVDSVLSNTSGIDNADKIRNFLINTYPTPQWGYKWLLIVGNIDSIPMRKLFPDPTNHATSGSGDSYNPPSDFYYAELTGQFDGDNDGYYGEYGQDNTEFTADIAVGRIPYNDSATIYNVLTRMIDFESNTSSYYKNHFLFMGAISNYANEDNNGYARTDGGALGEELKNNALTGWNYYRMNELAGIHPSTYACEAPLTVTNVVNAWDSDSFGLATWWAHGSKTASYRKVWNSDDGDSIPESGEMVWWTLLDIPNASGIDYAPSILFSCSCNNGWPDYANNFVRELLKNTSVGVVASNRISWYRIGWTTYNGGGNASIDYHFIEGFANYNYYIGDALNYSLNTYYANYFWWGWQSAQNIYDFNLYGDPSMYYFGKTQGVKEEFSKIAKNINRVIKYRREGNNIIFYLSGNIVDNNLSIYNISGRKEFEIKGISNKGNVEYKVVSNRFNTSGVYFAVINDEPIIKPIKLFIIN